MWAAIASPGRCDVLRIEQGIPAQQVPVNAYDDGHEFVVVVPLPGLVPDDIDIRVEEHEVVIQARLRGPRQDQRRYLLREWRTGPVARRLALPFPVDAE